MSATSTSSGTERSKGRHYTVAATRLFHPPRNQFFHNDYKNPRVTCKSLSQRWKECPYPHPGARFTLINEYLCQ